MRQHPADIEEVFVMQHQMFYDKVYGSLLGGVIGDAMGAPVEGWHYRDIEAKLGEVNDFTGEGTDDSAIRLILCEAILQNHGYVTADEFAQAFLNNPQSYKLFYIPVRNMFHKIQEETVLPVYAGLGNMQSSSSAMAISPMGIINAGNPRQAAVETYDVAGLIHGGEASTFCRDGACAVAAAVAEALSPDATVASILEASTAYLHRKSSALMIDLIHAALEMARQAGDYRIFRQQYYASRLRNIISDSRETVPAALALFSLAATEPARAIVYAVNFGRDADTLGTMVGGISGAFRGWKGLKSEWVEKVEAAGETQKELAHKLAEIALKKAAHSAKLAEKIIQAE
jgi:ADP-ribosylglycohydrolase